MGSEKFRERRRERNTLRESWLFLLFKEFRTTTTAADTKTPGLILGVIGFRGARGQARKNSAKKMVIREDALPGKAV